ncbi:MAG TPA: ectoine/hydroxyectoine ABC transporter substrate-binding protein EhuB [Acidimicrobiales bacterium]|nr:ectoine/hydroxyectoine ABC transporter substrate-binding protein EhuB [Acidimicrobiales bacterium]
MSNGHWSRREFLTRSAAFGAVAAAGPAVFAACSSSSTTTSSSGHLSSLQKSGTVKVGIAGEKPYGYTDSSGRVTGESAEVARAAFGSLGVHSLQATQVDFNSLIPGLNAGQFDVVTAGMFITPARCANALFSNPDYAAPEAFLVPKGNPQGVATYQDVARKNLTLGVLSGAVEQGYAQQSGVPNGQIQIYSSQNDLLQAVESKRVNAASLTNISLNSVVKDNPGANVEVTKPFFPVINGKQQISAGGFVFRKNDTALVSSFNQQLNALHSNGKWLQIVQPFGFTQENLPGPGVTTASLCAGS